MHTEQNQLSYLSTRLLQSHVFKGRMQLCSAVYLLCVFGSLGNKMHFLSVTLVRVAVSTPAFSSLCTSRSAKETPPPSRTLYH